MKPFKTSCFISLISAALILSSCGSSSHFSKRKYRKGVFKEHSVRTKRDRTKQSETYYTSVEKKDKQEEALDIEKFQQTALNKTVDSIPKIDQLISEVSQKKPTKRKEEKKYLNKPELTKTQEELQTPITIRSKKVKQRKKKNKLTYEQRIKRSKIIGWISVFMNIVFFILCTLCLFTFFISAIVILAALFITMMILTILSLIDMRKLRKKGISKKNLKSFKRAYMMNALGLLLMSLGLGLTSSILILSKGRSIAF